MMVYCIEKRVFSGLHKCILFHLSLKFFFIQNLGPWSHSVFSIIFGLWIFIFLIVGTPLLKLRNIQPSPHSCRWSWFNCMILFMSILSLCHSHTVLKAVLSHDVLNRPLTFLNELCLICAIISCIFELQDYLLCTCWQMLYFSQIKDWIVWKRFAYFK